MLNKYLLGAKVGRNEAMSCVRPCDKGQEPAFIRGTEVPIAESDMVLPASLATPCA